MSHPFGGVAQGSTLNNHAQNPGSYAYLQHGLSHHQFHPQHQPPQRSLPQPQPHHLHHQQQHHQQPQQPQSHRQHQQHQQQQPQPQEQHLPSHPQSLDQFPDPPNFANPSNDPNTAHPPAFLPVNPSSRSTFNLGSAAYAAIPGNVLVAQPRQEQQTNPATSDTALSHMLALDPRLDTLAAKDGLARPTNSLAIGDLSYQADMRCINGHLDALSAEQYDPGRFATRRAFFKPEAHALPATSTAINQKKRGRKTSPGDQNEPVEEIKRARGRPRLETGSHQDMKERRKEQIRLAQRAYRNRKETAIVELEAKVSSLEASNAEVQASFQTLLMDFVDRHALAAQIPELGRRLRQFQALLRRGSDGVDILSEESMSHPEEPGDNLKTPSSSPPASQLVVASQQPQKLLGGIIVTYEPESQTTRHESAAALDSPLDDGNYTYIKMPNAENASFIFDLSFLENTAPNQWSMPHWGSLPLPSTGAYLERTLGRRLHRRTTERAARLLAMESPPYDTMHRVFGFVRNYATLESIRDRIKTTLTRTSDEDLDAYSQPFHHIGGAGTHFSNDGKGITYPGGAPFPSTGFGMGPFTEKTMVVRDELLDALQRSKFPGWQGEWFDSYDVEKFLTQKSIKLPPGGNGFVEIPPGEFYHNPLDREASSPKDTLKELVSKKAIPNSNVIPNSNIPVTLAGSMPMHSAQSTITSTGTSLMPVSSMDSMLSIPATTALWLPGTAAPDFIGVSQSMVGNMPSLPAYHNTTFGLSGSTHFVYPPHTLDAVGNQVGNKRVWFSVEKFIESLGSKCTCVGRGPAFRKSDVIAAFWEASKPDTE